jgi:acetyl-CoA C-acetyltransferase
MKKQNSTFIIEGLRIPIGKKNGIYKNIIPEVFTAFLLEEFRAKYSFLQNETDEIILGCAVGTGGNMARYTALQAGFSLNTAAYTIDAQCASGIKAIILADNQIKSGANCIIAGGMESNSLAPNRQYQPADQRFIDNETFYTEASFAPQNFGEASLLKAAEKVALQFNISKKAMMQWSVESHLKAIKAIENEHFKEFILPYQQNKIDQSIKTQMTLERLIATQTDQLIDHTNTAHLHDGAAVHLLVSDVFCEKNKLKATFKIVATATAAGDPVMAPLGVIWATIKLLQETGLEIDEIALFEVNESFAVNALAFSQYFQINDSKMNIFGGNLAFGHPFGASGAINLLHLMAAMKAKNAKRGIVAIAAAGGLGMAVLIENLEI